MSRNQWHLVRRLETSGASTLQQLVNSLPPDLPVDGFRRIPALSFSPTEIMALVLGRDLLKPLEGTQLEAAVDSALAKITSALPPSRLDFARQMREFFSVGLGPHKAYARHPTRSPSSRSISSCERRAPIDARNLLGADGSRSHRTISR